MMLGSHMASGVNSSFVPLHVMMTARNLLFQYETLKHSACLMCSCSTTNVFPGATMLPECCHDTYAFVYFFGVFLIKKFHVLNCSFSCLDFFGCLFCTLVSEIKIVSIILILTFIVSNISSR